MAIPSRPITFELVPGSRLLKGWPPIVPDAANGMTEDDTRSAEDYGWHILLSSMIAVYDISEWDDPPWPLFEIWDMMSSAQWIRMTASYSNREDNQQSTQVEQWEQNAVGKIESLTRAGKKSGDLKLRLIKNDGSVQYPRKAAHAPRGIGSGVTIFPDFDTDESHSMTTTQNLESLFRHRNIEVWPLQSPN